MQLLKPPVSERFLASFDNPGVFDCGAFNLLKVAQDALLREVGKGSHNTYISQSFGLIRTRLMLAGLKQKWSGGGAKISVNPKKGACLFAVSPRFVDVGGELQHQYLQRILEETGLEDYRLVYLRGNQNGQLKPDARIAEITSCFRAVPITPYDKELIAEMRKSLATLRSLKSFTEDDIRQIEVGYDEFWQNYRAVRAYLEMTKPKVVVMAPGYYTEYFIAAARSLQIKVIELQHGVITPASHFYVYPEKIRSVARRALFADEVWLFGEYWKQQLIRGAEYEARQLKIFGDYFLRNPMPGHDAVELERFKQRFPTRVLIGTQTKRHGVFNDLVGRLSNRYREYGSETGIIVKLHPAEDPALYAEINALPNVFISSSSLDYLYGQCHYYVSMYSNTLFESTRFPELKRAVLHSEETAAFVEAIAASGVAVKMHVDDDPTKLDYPSQAVNPDHFFQKKLNPELLKALNPNAV